MTIRAMLKKFVNNTNWDGIRCIIKGDPNIREIMATLKKQKEIDNFK